MGEKRILVTDPIADEGLAILRRKGYEVDEKFGLTEEELIACVKDYDALIVRSGTKITAPVLDAASRLKIIGRAGVTVDSIDVAAASEHGVVVCNAPVSNIVSTAEHTMALLLACARKLPQANASVHEGRWERAEYTGTELYHKTLAIFGLGRVGGLVAERARAFGMHVVGYDPYCNPERANALGVELYASIEDILPIADFITVHLPRTPETIGMFGPEEFAAMKEGVILVNPARGGIYQEKSLADFLAAGKIAAVGLDVYDEEPAVDSPFAEFPQALLTPHVAPVTHEAQVRAGKQIAEYVWEGLEGSIVSTALNSASQPSEVIDVVGPYVSACKLAGAMLSQFLGKMPKTLRLEMAGSVADADSAYLVAGVLDGMLSYRSVGNVSPSNARQVATRHGIEVACESLPDAGEYASSVRIVADGVDVGVTLFGMEQRARIIALNGYKIDIAPAKQGLVFEYVDAPGRVGTIGTILGEAGVNITTMQIGTNPDEARALIYMNVEGFVDEAVLNQLREAIDLTNLWYIAL